MGDDAARSRRRPSSCAREPRGGVNGHARAPQRRHARPAGREDCPRPRCAATSNEGLIFLETDAPLRSVAEDVARAVGGTQSDVGPPGRIVIEVSVADGFYTVRNNRKVQPEYDALRYCVNVFGPQDPVELNERTLRLARRLVELRPDAHVVALDANYDPIWTSGTPAGGADS